MSECARNADRRKPVTLDLGDGVQMSFVWIPPTGDDGFWMGERGRDHTTGRWRPSEEPRHRVRVAEFYLGVTPVTQAQFDVWTAALAASGQTPPDWRPDAHAAEDADHPAVDLSWRDAVAFCAWLTERSLAAGDAAWCAGHVATLPTEAEWEYACRAGTTTEYCSGDGAAALRKVGWFDENAGRTQPVGTCESSNAWGLWDMHGNVWEWCWDVFDAAPYARRVDGAEDPGWADREAWLRAHGASIASAHTGLPAGRDAFRAMRGGSWINVARLCRSASRDWWGPGIRYRDQGFRVCLVPGPPCGQPDAPGDGARRDAEAESEGAAAGGTELSTESFSPRPRRRQG